MNRKIYHPSIGIESTSRVDVQQWNIEASGKSLEEGVREVYKDEVYSILKRLNVLNGVVLDAGCGYGRWVKVLHNEGISVYGVDFARAAIISLAKNLPDVPLVVGDVRSLPFKNEVFNVILSLGVVEHSEKGPKQALKEGYRCLKSRGTMVVSVPFISVNRLLNPIVVVRRFASSIKLVRYLFRRGPPQFFQYEFSLNEFISYLREAGFKVWFWRPVWIEFGVRDDFRFLYGLFYPIIKWLGDYFVKFIRYFFGAFVVFIANK